MLVSICLRFPQFIVRQAPILFDYFVAKLAPLVSILAPDPGALSSLRNFRGSFPAGLERAGTDIVTVFLPMAFDSDLVVRVSSSYSCEAG